MKLIRDGRSVLMLLPGVYNEKYLLSRDNKVFSPPVCIKMSTVVIQGSKHGNLSLIRRQNYIHHYAVKFGNPCAF
jgi:hypothetical protein